MSAQGWQDEVLFLSKIAMFLKSFTATVLFLFFLLYMKNKQCTLVSRSIVGSTVNNR